MKKIIFIFLAATLTATLQAKTNNVTYNNVVLNICDEELVGCADKLTIDGKDYLVEVISKEVRKKYMDISTNMRRHKKLKTKLLYIKGYSVKEKGHFPNPMAAFDVFKLDDLKQAEAK